MKTSVKGALMAATALAVLTSGAHAADWYVGGSVAYVDLKDSMLTPNLLLTPLPIEYDSGYGLNFVGGRKFGTDWRAELEFSYRTNDVSGLGTPPLPPPGGGDVTTMALMLNGYYDFPTGTPWRPYVGGGLGGAQVSMSIPTGPIDDSDTVFAYQVMAGIGYDINPTLHANLGYRYFATQDPGLSTVFGTPFDTEIATHNIELGIRADF